MALGFQGPRPRLYFGAEAVEELRSRAKTTHLRHFEALRAWTDENLWRTPLRGVDLGFMRGSAEVYFEETFSLLSNFMLTYLLTEERRYAEASRRWLREMCGYPTEPGNQYAIGPYIAALAQGYDWLAGELPEEERSAIREHLILLVREAYECSFSPERAWWHGAYLHHDFWIPTAGYGLGALALLDEVAEARSWLDRAAAELVHAFDVLGDDGAWVEGVADWVYGLVLVLLFSDAYRRSGGESLYERPWLRNTWLYRLYSWLPDDTYVYLNDSFRSGRYNILGSASCHVLHKLAAEYQNGYMQWLGDRDEAFDYRASHPGVYRSPYDWIENRAYRDSAMHCLGWNLLWYEPAVEERRPDDLPTSHHFANQGVVISRSSWGPDSTVATFACGPIGGHEAHRRILENEPQLGRGATHAHAQATSFTLYAQGHYYIVPPGYGKHAGRFQNVVAVNGGGQVWDPRRAGTIRGVELAEDADYALGDVSSCYPDDFGIRSHWRHFVFLKPDFLVICDLIGADGFPSRVGRHYAWQIHTDPKLTEVVPIEYGLSLRGPGSGEIALHVLAPEHYGLAMARFADRKGKPFLDESAIVLNFQVPSETAFVIVLALTDQGQGREVSRIVGENCVGALIGEGSDTRAVVFARAGSTGKLAYDVGPARSARHLIAGLAPATQYVATTSLQPWLEAQHDRRLLTAEETFVNRVVVEEKPGGTASTAGLLRFVG